MIRTLATLLALAGSAGFASAQPRHNAPLPLSPGVHQGSPIGPGTQFIPQPTHRFPAGGRNMQGHNWAGPGHYFSPYGRNNLFGYGGYGYGYGYGGYDYGGYGYGPVYDYAPVVVEVPVLPPSPPQRRVVLANEFPATLALQFPAAAEVWLNGEKVEGEASEERVLTSPILKQGEQYTFDVKARWAVNGKTYENIRTVTLGSGDRSRLLVVSGAEVK
ncbi:hypothetical protein VT84_01430 [Gemmata sp. SH-PL17]|uniref:TIGR03000 domain-containing protein n=1 Tax=Gemmata sp. SH-PL17 TaxID=1630693 RepID=UPI00078BC1BB|nr:TIGR03000 domain-containing protein [Gemmata sp. SH-PL17]AMV23042.1 hypothetical protein VT84_01430 [Gemmata sp. SH-PL17]